MNRKKYLFKNILIFALSAFSTKLITFLLVPLYTNVLTPDEYGIVDLYFTISSFLFPLFTLNISEAIYRFSMDKDCDNVKIYNNGMICFILCTLLGLVLLPIFSAIPIYKDYSLDFYIYLITLSLEQILLISLKGQEKLKLFSAGNIIKTLSVAILNIIFLVVFNYGIHGYFLSYILANTITIIYALYTTEFTKQITKFKFDKKLFLDMIKYSVVLIPTSFMWWITNSSDRIMISYYVDSYSNGLYAISYKIPNLLTIAASIFNQAWIFSAIKEKDNDDNEKFTNRIFNLMFFSISLLSIVILLSIKLLFKVYVANEYYEAWKYVPILLFGFIFMTLATFISTSYNVHKDSKGFLYSGLVGAISNIIMNFILIPPYGVYGAAIATFISYVLVFIYRVIDTKKYVKINLSYNHYISIVILSLCSLLVYFESTIIYILIIVLMLLFLLINREIIKNIINEATKILKHN